MDRLLPEESIRLFAIATRFPDKLAGKIMLQTLESGVFDVAWGTDTIRLLVLNQIPAADRNAILNLFSAERSRILAGVTRVAGDFQELSSVLEELLKNYRGESDMPQTLAEMLRDSQSRVLADLSPAFIAEELPLEKPATWL